MVKLYWLVPILLFTIQILFSSQTFNQIKFEEIDLSILDPYWVRNGVLSSGAASNLGWYFTMITAYEIFGFDLFTAKFIRLGLSLISLLCLALLLKKYLGEKKAILPLLIIGLSPTLLYFNTQMTVYGIELQFLPILLLILGSINFKTKLGIFLNCLLWAIFMFGLLIYPTFFYFLPSFVLLYLAKLKHAKLSKSQSFEYGAISLSSFLLPLVIAYLYISNRELLIYDEAVKSGLFRGAGLVSFTGDIFLKNMQLVTQNLFLTASGYYYELNQAEFSHFYPLLALIILLFFAVKTWINERKSRLILLSILLVFLLNLILAGFSLDPTPGLRRQTGVLASIYLLLVYFLHKLQFSNKLLILACFVILIHHLSVLPLNLSHIRDLSQYRENLWISVSENPRQNLESYLQKVQKEDVELTCFDDKNNPINCRYNQIYAIISASCLWNKLPCHEIKGYDLKSGKHIKLNIDLFNQYYFGRYGREVIAT